MPHIRVRVGPSGGRAHTVSGGDTYTVRPFENDFGDDVLHSGILDVLSHGEIVGTSVTGMVVVSTGDIAIGTHLNSGGEQVVKGAAQGTRINSGGQEVVDAGGTIIGTTISAGGSQTVAAGGTTNVDTINDGGVEFVAGTADDTTINAGGKEIVSGGTASGTTINSGGEELVSIDGKALATTIN